jgi:hypothetical protein
MVSPRDLVFSPRDIFVLAGDVLFPGFVIDRPEAHFFCPRAPFLMSPQCISDPPGLDPELDLDNHKSEQRKFLTSVIPEPCTVNEKFYITCSLLRSAPASWCRSRGSPRIRSGQPRV